jgi:16S rRNA (adenine1518-N6/adenine1519-N6)-dimethyltransferase
MTMRDTKKHHTLRTQGARLGQHFLTRSETASKIALALPPSSGDIVLEIGPGHGILTRELLKHAGRVVAVEKDPGLYTELQDTFAGEIASARLTLIEQDVRDFDPSSLLPTPYSLVANIPYYITGYIIRKFLTHQHQPHNMALLIQKEVAERITARNGKHSLLSLSVHAYGTPRIAHTVRAGAFSPPPKVDSAVLVVENIHRNHFLDPAHEERFFTLLHCAFQSKRKQIGSTLAQVVSPDAFMSCHIPKTARPEDVQLREWLLLARA